MTSPESADRYALMLQIARGIDGFMKESNVAIWDSLLTLQTEGHVQGDIMEIGVFKGRSASILCQHKRPDEELWLVDFSQFLDHARKNLTPLLSGGVKFLHCKSSELWSEPALMTKRRRFRWLHIDGEHTGYAVTNDLNLGADLLSDHGLVCIDDFFNPSYPQITASVFDWLANRPHELELVLCGENKAYLSRPTFAHFYLDFIRSSLAEDLEKRGISDLTLFKTAPTGDSNGWGIGPRYQDRDHYGLDENPDLIR